MGMAQDFILQIISSLGADTDSGHSYGGRVSITYRRLAERYFERREVQRLLANFRCKADL
jgi:hypothetical protein